MVFIPLYLLYSNGILVLTERNFWLLVATYFTAPLLLQFFGTSIYVLKARTMGRFFLVASLLMYYYYHVSLQWPWLLGSSFFFALIILSSKFSLQAYLFCVPFFLFWDPSILLILLLGFLISLLISRGFSYYILMEHVFHQKMYFTKAKFYGSSSAINNFSDIAFISNPLNLFRDAKKYFKIAFYKVSYTRLLLLLPLPFLFMIMFYSGKVVLSWNEVVRFSLFWCSGLLFAFLFTSSKTFISLGHPDRYIEYALLPALFIISQTNFFSYFNFGVILLIHFLFYIVINAKDLRRIFMGEANTWERKSFQSVRKYLFELQGKRIICIPMKLALHFADIHNHKYLWATTFVEPYVVPSFFDETFEIGNAPFPKSLKFLKDKYSLNTVVLMNIHLQKYQQQLKDLNARLETKIDNLSIFSI
jgi:hypothetical protein